MSLVARSTRAESPEPSSYRDTYVPKGIDSGSLGSGGTTSFAKQLGAESMACGGSHSASLHHRIVRADSPSQVAGSDPVEYAVSRTDAALKPRPGLHRSPPLTRPELDEISATCHPPSTSRYASCQPNRCNVFIIGADCILIRRVETLPGENCNPFSSCRLCFTNGGK
jgi:hypothetical protein